VDGYVAKRLGVFLVAVVLALVPALAPATDREAPAPLPPVPHSTADLALMFGDDFDGPALDPGRWHTCFWWAGSTCSIEPNEELQLYTPGNVTVADGVLRLQARPEAAVAWNDRTYGYTSGMISSGGRDGGTEPGFTFTYGYMEARVKVPAGAGLWPAFWALPADHGWPPELDVMEIVGNRPDAVRMTYHFLDAGGSHQGPGRTWEGPDFSAGWHTFGLDWGPDTLVWYVDDIERWRFTDASAITASPSYVVLNLAVGGTLAGAPDPSTPFPGDYLVDYVRVWGTPETTLSGPPTAG
jgi:beta-glucanase (GH16 family)